MSATDVVTVFLIHDGRILVLRRRGKAGADGDRWAGVRGDLGHDPRGQAYGDISEETGFGPDDVELLKVLRGLRSVVVWCAMNATYGDAAKRQAAAFHLKRLRE